MQILIYIAASLLFAIGIAHSYLGERYVLTRLFRRGNLPKLFGGTEFTERTLRFAWHLTSVCWWSMAVILVLLLHPDVSRSSIAFVIGGCFLVHGCIAGVASRGRHLSWIVFLAAGLIAVYAGVNWS